MEERTLRVEDVVERYLDAFARRNIAEAVACFADDAEVTEPVGTFTGKDGVRRLLEWDVALSPVAESRRTGVGLLVHDRVAVEEEVLHQTYRGVTYEYPVIRVFEVDESGRIRRMRVYLDRLGMVQRIADGLPGARGWLFRPLINFIVAQVEKGLQRS